MSEFVDKFSVNWTKLTFAAASCYIGLLHLEYIDIEYSAWLFWLLAPLFVTFILPAVIAVLIYTSALIYQLRRAPIRFQNWRSMVMAVWDAHGKLWHGYEVVGLENIPKSGGAMLVFYHGALPIDMYYLTARIYLTTGGTRLVRAVVDRFLYLVPGWRGVLQAMRAIPGARSACAKELRAGELLSVAPGGVYEAQYGDHGYRINWKTRIGFAKVALSTGVPVLPVFTRNVREAFRTVHWCLNVSPIAPVYGGFPVKLVTYIGKPIYPKLSPELPISMTSIEDLPKDDPNQPIHAKDNSVGIDRRKTTTDDDDNTESGDSKSQEAPMGNGIEKDQSEAQSEDVASAWDLRKRVEAALEELISTNQRIPGSILCALVERFVRLHPIKAE